MDTVVVRVPATIANLGSGFDAIGLALSWHNEVRIERRRDDVVVVSGVGDLANGLPRDSTNLIVRSLESVMGPLRSITVNQIVAIPMGRGFGSSAAAVVGGLVGARALAGTDDTDEQLLERAVTFEGHADNVAPCLLGGITVSAPASIKPLVCVAPQAMQTKVARAALPTEVSRADATANLGRAALLVAALSQGRSDVLMDATKDLLHQPVRFGLMPESGELVRALRAEGIAAFLAGAGPSVAALVDDKAALNGETTARALLPEGWDVRLESIDPQGARIVSEREK